jgi:hypothetical protein
MQHDTEENLLNSKFNDPIYYIFKNYEFYTLVKFIGNNPLSLKTEYFSKNLPEIIQNGKFFARNNGILFIEDTIFS